MTHSHNLLGVVRPANPVWVLGSPDKSRRPPTRPSCSPALRRTPSRLGAGCRDALQCKGGEIWIELDPQPIPLVGFGHQPHRAGAEERVEHHAGAPALAATAAWVKLPPDGEMAEYAYRSPLPRLSTADAGPFRAASQQRAFNQGGRERGKVLTAKVAGCQLPDIPWVGTERVTDHTPSL
jgi:hypothetical protein